MSLGSDLTDARVEAGLTLQQVADATRIRRTVIERIEANDFTLCGGDVYARGHVRTIARVVGADPDALVAEFERLHVPHPPTAAEVFESETGAPAERRGANWTAAMAAALVVVLAIVGFQVFRGGSSGSTAGNQASQPVISDTSSVTAAPSSSAPSTSAPSTPSSSAPVVAPPTSTAVAATGVTVVLHVTDHVSWVSAKGSKGNTVFEGLLQPGATKTFTDKTRVTLIIGRAGSVTLKVNGKDIGSPGAGAQVARLSFGPGDPTAG